MIFDFVRFDDTSHEHKQSSSRRNDSVRTRRSQAASRFTPSFVCLLLLFCPVPQDLRFFFAREPAVRIVYMHALEKDTMHPTNHFSPFVLVDIGVSSSFMNQRCFSERTRATTTVTTSERASVTVRASRVWIRGCFVFR